MCLCEVQTGDWGGQHGPSGCWIPCSVRGHLCSAEVSGVGLGAVPTRAGDGTGELVPQSDVVEGEGTVCSVVTY